MSKNENTLGSRISNAETLIINLRKFVNFKSLRTEDSPDEVENLIKKLKQTSLEEADALQQYTLAVDVRSKHFDKEATSIRKIITSINAYVKSLYDKDSKEATTINQKVTELRTSGIKKNKKNPDEKSISTSQLSYASVTQNFAELIASLQALSQPYTPPNTIITLEALKNKHKEVESANNNVKTTYSNLSTLRTQKNILSDDLTNRCQRLKNSVKSQYGNASAEYAEIKGLKI
jgi:hypothetical protein